MLFTIYAQSNKGPSHLETMETHNEAVAFNAARYHAKKHGVVFLIDNNSGKTERINGRGEYLVVNR